MLRNLVLAVACAGGLYLTVVACQFMDNNHHRVWSTDNYQDWRKELDDLCIFFWWGIMPMMGIGSVVGFFSFTARVLTEFRAWTASSGKRRKGAVVVVSSLAILFLVGVVFKFGFAYPNKMEHRSERITEREIRDSFASNAVVYAYLPPAHVLGDKLTMVVCSEIYEEAYALMLKESDANFNIAVSLGNQLLKKDYVPESEYKEALAKYILNKQKENKLLFMPKDFKMQIVQKKFEGEHPNRSIFECRALQPGSEGMILYIQAEYFATKPVER